MRSRARTFYLASLFLPQPVRSDVRLIYAYFRTIDDLVDEPGHGSVDEVFAELRRWEDALLGRRAEAFPSLGPMLRVADRYRIPIEHFVTVIEGARFDVRMQTVDTLEELIHYCTLVAGSVGIVMAHVLGAEAPEAFEAANDLGVAMQITNILRDVGEDVRRDRLYLPLAELARAGCSPDSVRMGHLSPGLRTVMRLLMSEARQRYRRGEDGTGLLDPYAKFAVHLSARLYEQILVKIERRNFDVFTERARVGSVEKWLLALPAYAQHRQVGFRR
ncbi:MAG: hypothetical protein DLM70_09745 [Chloroflexi bacterium]|nr:MAG: hypothetical protein DLM70_09745 [Chloroflexota bacterium]